MDRQGTGTDPAPSPQSLSGPGGDAQALGVLQVGPSHAAWKQHPLRSVQERWWASPPGRPGAEPGLEPRRKTARGTVVTPWSQQAATQGQRCGSNTVGETPPPTTGAKRPGWRPRRGPGPARQQKQEHNQIQKTHTENAQDSQVKGHQEHQHLTAARNLTRHGQHHGTGKRRKREVEGVSHFRYNCKIPKRAARRPFFFFFF